MAEIIRVLKDLKLPVYGPDELEYQRSVAVANLLYRFTRPVCVVQPKDSSEIRTVVKEAKQRNIRITIKNGGHSYAGFSTTDTGILLDLLRMKEVTLDMKSTQKTVTLQGGALWGHAYSKLVNGQHDGFIINGGRCPTVGVSGLILGGGLGPFTRSVGMGCDSLLEATIVTADCKEVKVKASDDRRSDQGRLFWALQGAGGGNFGVVVELKMKVQELRNKTVVAGVFTWSPKTEDMDDFMIAMKDFYMTNWEPQMTIDSSWVCDLQQTTSDLAVRFLVYYDGSKSGFDNRIDGSITNRDLAKGLKRRSLAEKSTRFLHETLATQWLEDIIRAHPSSPKRFYTIYTSFVYKNNKETIKNTTRIIRKEMKDFRRLFTGEKALLQVTWIHSGGEASRKRPEDTAYPWRDCDYHVYIMLQWEDKWLEKDMRGFLHTFKKQLRPFSLKRHAVYINFPDITMQEDTHERAYFGDNYKELQQIKKIWDKVNFFNWGQGVRLPKQEGAALALGTGVPRFMTMADMNRMGGGDDNDGPVTLAAEEVLGEEALANDQELTDAIASEHWDTGIPRANKFEGGIYGLTDLGFEISGVH